MRLSRMPAATSTAGRVGRAAGGVRDSLRVEGCADAGTDLLAVAEERRCHAEGLERCALNRRPRLRGAPPSWPAPLSQVGTPGDLPAAEPGPARSANQPRSP